MDGVVRSLPRRSLGSVYRNTNSVGKRLHTDLDVPSVTVSVFDFSLEVVWLKLMTGRSGLDRTVIVSLKTRSPARLHLMLLVADALPIGGHNDRLWASRTHHFDRLKNKGLFYYGRLYVPRSDGYTC
jgi:hypothetical protein